MLTHHYSQIDRSELSLGCFYRIERSLGHIGGSTTVIDKGARKGTGGGYYDAQIDNQ